jgi:hypothetical protein
MYCTEITGIDFHSDRATLTLTDQPHDNLFVPLLTISVVTEFDQFAVVVLAFERHAGDVIEHPMPAVERAPGEGLLNRSLALHQRIHRLITVHIHIRGILDAAELPQTGIGMMVAQGECAARIDPAADNHGQGAAYLGLGA